MHPFVIAIDVDGTLYDGASVAPSAVAALAAATGEGHIVILVTGRRWGSLTEVVPDVLPLCTAAVCEEGTVLVETADGQPRLLATALDPALVIALQRAGVPDLDVGAVVVGAPVEHVAAMAAANEEVGGDRRLVVNKGSVALVPRGCDKATGLRAALAALHLQHRWVLAIGDAANDLPMFAMATIAVAVANADDAVRSAGITRTIAPFGLGVAEALQLHLGIGDTG
ncbi:MAG: HAD hydrolase family protein [Actinomycetota bacterium]|nr:HAD hydrolase family protein [Actinomycetota bacterium]